MVTLPEDLQDGARVAGVLLLPSKFEAGGSRGRQVLGARWHPLSDAHVVILSSDSTIWFVNCLEAVGIAELKLRADCDERFVGFCLGEPRLAAADDPWACLSVFVLLNNGDVLIFCPVLPGSAVLPTASVAYFLQHQALPEDIPDAKDLRQWVGGTNMGASVATPSHQGDPAMRFVRHQWHEGSRHLPPPRRVLAPKKPTAKYCGLCVVAVSPVLVLGRVTRAGVLETLMLDDALLPCFQGREAARCTVMDEMAMGSALPGSPVLRAEGPGHVIVVTDKAVVSCVVDWVNAETDSGDLPVAKVKARVRASPQGTIIGYGCLLDDHQVVVESAWQQQARKVSCVVLPPAPLPTATFALQPVQAASLTSSRDDGRLARVLRGKDEVKFCRLGNSPINPDILKALAEDSKDIRAEFVEDIAARKALVAEFVRHIPPRRRAIAAAIEDLENSCRVELAAAQESEEKMKACVRAQQALRQRFDRIRHRLQMEAENAQFEGVAREAVVPLLGQLCKVQQAAARSHGSMGAPSQFLDSCLHNLDSVSRDLLSAKELLGRCKRKLEPAECEELGSTA
mmetsp:Transcript_37836/g.84668  ORF Transcript_37836/g.84668 Transcript_37836/m.84668 type:complete len:569 (+) Transcript_37836:159-1865(+)